MELQKSGEDRKAKVEQLMDDRNVLEGKIKDLEEVVNDEFISTLIEHSWFNFQLKVKGREDDIEAFVQKAAGLGKSKGNSVRHLGDYFIVDLNYANTVSRESLDEIISDTNLEIINITAGRGISF
jgi:hypothetical protein